MKPEKMLQGLTVLDWSPFAPVKFGTMVLADLGADVISVERPASTYARGFDLLTSDTHPRWLWYMRNKRVVGIDLRTSEGMEIMRSLVRRTDVLIEGYAPGTAERLGLGYDEVKELNESLVYCSVSGFGESGAESARWGHEPSYQAMGGIASLTPDRDGKPSLVGVPLSDCVASLYSVVGILAGIVRARATGEHARVDISIRDSLVSLWGVVAAYHWAGRFGGPGDVRELGGDPASNIYETADGRFLTTSAVEPWAWERLCSAIGCDEYAEDFEPVGPRAKEIHDGLASVFRSRTLGSWMELNQDQNVGLAPVMTIQEILADQDVQRDGMVQDISYEPVGLTKQIATPLRVSGSIPPVEWIPRRGEHTDEVLQELGYDPVQIERFRLRRVLE